MRKKKNRKKKQKKQKKQSSMDLGDESHEQDNMDEDDQILGVHQSKRSTAGTRQSVWFHNEYINVNIDLNTENATNMLELTDNEVEDHIIHVIMMQYPLKAGFKLFEDCGKEAVTKELS